MPTKLSLTEPQNAPYWILKRSLHIKKYHGCEEEVEENVIRRWEIDFNLKVDKQNCTKCCASKVDAFYYHLNIECLWKRGPNVLLGREMSKSVKF